MGNGKWEIRNEKLLLISCFLLLIFIVACGRRGDPVAIVPYKKAGVVKDLKAFRKGREVRLTWGMPFSNSSSQEGKYSPIQALKGFVVLRAEVPEGMKIDECECQYSSLDLIMPDSESLYRDAEKKFEYLDKESVQGHSYAYKIAVMDNDNRVGEDSNIALVEGVRPEREEPAVMNPGAPTGLLAVYTQKSVILTWDEVRGKEIKYYRVYRSAGRVFVLIGEPVTPAFTDNTVESSQQYHYRITAVGYEEGPPSEEIEVRTKTL